MLIDLHRHLRPLSTLLKPGLVLWRACPYTIAGIVPFKPYWPLHQNSKGTFCVRWPLGHTENGYEPVCVPDNHKAHGLRVFVNCRPENDYWTHIVLTGCSRGVDEGIGGCLFAEFGAVPWPEFIAFRSSTFDAYARTFTLDRKESWPQASAVQAPELSTGLYRLFLEVEQSETSRHGKDIYYHLIR